VLGYSVKRIDELGRLGTIGFPTAS
jgi:hypothetical protein